MSRTSSKTDVARDASPRSSGKRKAKATKKRGPKMSQKRAQTDVARGGSARSSGKRQAKTARQRRVAAYHEAGHVVADVCQGLHVVGVTIVPNSTSLAHVSTPGILGYNTQGDKTVRRSLGRAQIVALYAGAAAVRVHDPDEPWVGREKDDKEAFELSRKYNVLPRNMAYVGDASHWEYLGKLERKAEKLVRSNWLAVEALAQALLERNTLTGEEATEIVRPHVS